MSPSDDILKRYPEFGEDPELKHILDSMQSFKVPATKPKETAWSEFVTSIETRETEQVKTLRLYRLYPAAAAAVVFLLIASWLTYAFFDTTEIMADHGKTIPVVLPDKSTVKLNAGSTLTYRDWRFKATRKVVLQGEALFHVGTPGRFTVETGNKTIEVLGTSFNVYSRCNSFSVQCLTGKVKVDIENVIDTILIPGQAIKTTPLNSKPEFYKVDTLKAASWTRGEFWYDAEPLSSVLEEMERQFNIIIEFSGDGDRLYTGYFNQNDLETALVNVCAPMSLQFETLGSEKVKIW